MTVATTDLLDSAATRSATSPTRAVPVAAAPGIEAWHVESPWCR